MLLPGGVWVLGVGDSSPEIRKIKAYIRAMFRSYAGHLADTDDFDLQLYDVVCEIQRRYGLPVTGYISYGLKVKMGYVKEKPKKLPQIHTVCGTGVPGDRGPDADVGRWLSDPAHRYADWWWTGYPAAPVPMWPSIMAGVGRLVTDIDQRSDPGEEIWLCGYSQGAIVASLVYKYHMLPAGSALHNRLPDLKRAFMFANPMRQEGVGGTPGAGALEDRLENTPPWWREYAHKDDIYSAVPTGDGWGENIRAITKLIMGDGMKMVTGRDSIIAQLIEVGINPFSEAWPLAMSLMKAGMFFGSGTGPHVKGLPVAAAIDHFRNGK